MTQFFRFETLTWPEVAALRRDTPLVIPLGGGYSEDLLSEALGSPDQVGLLPSIPFGWRGSGLSVPEGIFANLLSNLVASLRDDGFTRAYILAPPGLDIGLGTDGIHLPYDEVPIRANPFPEDSARDRVILIPIGHTEQHGYHLPLSTDTLIIEAISLGTVSARPDRASAMPVYPYGASTHRATFAGTLNCTGRAFEDFWLAGVESLVNRGFNRFYLLSGHGGNCSFLTNVVKYAGERFPEIFCATAWLYLSGPLGIDSLNRHRRSQTGGMGHAGELETSLILHLNPSLVHLDRAVDETDFISTPSYFMDWAEGGALVANPPWLDDTATGGYGAGSLGTAEHGAIWLEAAIQEKAAHVHEIHEQYERRRFIRLGDS
ncbi:MAG TPA: creatininase family protein [Anaerolineales bacterium]|nr:creatininase family protein [Anaerolineales bacterium]